VDPEISRRLQTGVGTGFGGSIFDGGNGQGAGASSFGQPAASLDNRPTVGAASAIASGLW
jgi:hypothetical protein